MRMLMLVIVMALGLTANAQGRRGERMERLTPEQRVELHLKKMTLDLDLNEKQQAEVKKLLIEQSKKHEQVKATVKARKEEGVKPTADERYEMQSKRLDDEIAMQKEMKKILTAEQFEKFKKMREERKEKVARRANKIKKKERR
ncbi:hypothetical protein [Flavobacterium coralii]|uniref:hypothetical protein n=1 Tax=Flavobacterium coralii TaxID=2838017 RepID=UPI00269FBAC2